MGILDRFKTQPRQVTITATDLDTAKQYLGLHPTVTLTDQSVWRYRLPDCILPTGDGYLIGDMRIIGDRPHVHINGIDVGALDDRSLASAITIFKKTKGQPVRCVLTWTGHNWNTYVNAP